MGSAMQEETGQPFFFTGRWRGRKLWVLICASILAAAVAFLLVLVSPSLDSEAQQIAGTARETALETARTETAGEGESEQPQEPAVQEGGQQPLITPGTGEQAPGVVVEFPEPAGITPEEPPPGGYRDIYGHWVLDMSGSAYGLTNCHIVLNEEGTISSPPDYDQVFQIAASTFTWQEGSPAFSASLQLILKMSSGQVTIPVQVDLAGNVAGSMLAITGSFTASPQGEAYAPYAQQGDFSMLR